MKRFWLATRPYSFTAAIVPVLIGTAAAKLLLEDLGLNWLHFALVLLGSVGSQVVANVINDVVDADTELDNPENYGKFNCIVAGLVSRAEALRIVYVVGALSLAIGAYLVWATTPAVLAVVGVGAFLAIFYTAPPLKLKYVALGDVCVLLGFGLGILFGAYMVQAHAMDAYLSAEKVVPLLIYALPSSALVVAILHANNHRDRGNDREYGAKTLANLLSESASKKLLYALIVGAYVFVAVAIFLPAVTIWWLAVLLSVPPLMAVLKKLKADDFGGMTIPQIAQLHGAFGILTTLGLVAAIVQRGMAG